MTVNVAVVWDVTLCGVVEWANIPPSGSSTLTLVYFYQNTCYQHRKTTLCMLFVSFTYALLFLLQKAVFM
jgi:hypothetical protein